MSGGSKSQTVSNEPWDVQEDFLMGSAKNIYSPQGQAGLSVGGLYPRAYNLSQKPRQFYPGQLNAPMSTRTNEALQNLWQFGANPSETEGLANQQLQSTLRGDYLYGGPGFNAAYGAAANNIIPQVQGMWSSGGRLNSGLAKAAMTQELGDAFAGLYEGERGKQMLAAGMAPQMQAMEQARLGAQQQVGQTREAYQQRNIDANKARWDFKQNEPYDRLNWFNSILGTGSPYTQQSTTGAGGSPIAGALGGGLLGYGAGTGLAELGGLAAAGGAGVPASMAFLASPWTMPLAVGAGLLGGGLFS